MVSTSRETLATTYCPRSVRQVVLEAAHHPVANAHSMRNMISYLSQKFWWPLHTEDISIYLSTCLGFQNINNSQRRRPPMQINIGAPFHRICVDWTGPLPVKVGGNRFLLTVVDPFTKCEGYSSERHNCKDRCKSFKDTLPPKVK